MSPLDYLYSRLNYERITPPSDQGAFRLRRMRHLLRMMRHPERQVHIVHIGGTKGKGSTCEMLAAMLLAGGWRVGLYTSPHLERLEERFRVDGQPCEPAELDSLIEAVRQAAEQVEAINEGPPTFFELTTAMAFEHFRRQQCQLAVVEVGLGGRLDSTNVCDPVVSVVTSIGLDHQHILGDTIEQIAQEKAGIIKPGVPVVSGVAQPEAQRVICSVAKQRGALLWQKGADFDVQPSPAVVGGEAGSGSDWGSRFDFISQRAELMERRNWYVGMPGRHQIHNAAVALATMDALKPLGLAGTEQAQQQGLAAARCAGRIERFSGSPEILLDTAHNVDSIKALCTVLQDRPAEGKTVVVFGTSADKDARGMLALLADVADNLILTRYWSNPRWYDPSELASMIRNPIATVFPQPAEALEQAISLAGPLGRVVICGSFFLAAELRGRLRERK